MKRKVLRSLTYCFLVLSTAALLRADRDADRRNERIPVGHKMRPPLHRAILPFGSFSSPTGYTPQQLRHAYGFDQLGTTGAGQIIAIVDAYGSPTIQADLNTFCATFNIPSTTVQVYYPQGTPPADSGWASETSLDVEWAHAIAPGATIALIASKSASTADLLAAVDYAVSIGAKQVSMSWGGSEFSSEGSSDFHFNVSGVTFLASSGDSGSYGGVSYPSCSPYVVGVGGTTLQLDSSANITSETAWSYNASYGWGSGGGISAYETAPSYQAGWWSGAYRGVPDVAYDADPFTGVPVYLTGSGWGQWGGTSMSAPQWAALCALANSLRSQSINSTPGLLYSLATANYAGYYRDITSGSNGQYSAGSGYDLVTGLGSPIANQLVLALAGGFSSTQVVAPVFFPPAGTYSGAQNVTIISATPGVSIRYTTDGSAPSETNGTLYAGPVSVSNTTLKAIAYETGFTDSTVATGIYTIGTQIAAPAFSPVAGNYTSAQTVTISTTTGGASIRYTTDGSTPSETNGTLYSGPVSIGGTTTLNAIAYETGYIDSPVASSIYTINLPPAIAPVFNPAAGTYGSTQTVTITSATSGASIRYTIDGSTPSETNGALYSTPVIIITTTTLRAIAYETGFLDSPVTSGLYTIVSPTAAPVFSPAAGTYASAQTVSITSTTGGASIRYTTDGSTPSETNGTLYSGPVSISHTTMLKAIAYESGFADSPVTNGLYTIISSPAAALNVIYNFSGSAGDGHYPEAPLVQGSDGSFYGTTAYGGTGYGTVFKVTSAGVLSNLASFSGSNGSIPYAGLVLGSDGNFYGTTSSGGSSSDGTVFKMTPAGVLTTLVSFNGTNGSTPEAPLVQGSDGNFYGTTTTVYSSTVVNGTVFKMTPAGVLTSLVSFNFSTTGGNPYTAGLVQGSDGNFYGTTVDGGSSGRGTVFKMTPAGVLTSLVSFNYTNGQSPTGLVQGSDGNFYGATADGGSFGEGTVFKITPAGVLTTLASFNYPNGYYPAAGLVQGSDGNFYGTTEDGGSFGDGTVFKITPAGVLTTLVSFDYPNGYYPAAGLVQGSDGNFYGTTEDGGISASGGYGVVFQLIIQPQVATPTFSPVAGTYASTQTVTIATTTSGASIRYTTNGSTPSETNGTLYSGPVSIGGTTTLNAIAYTSGIADSTVATAVYTLSIPGVVSAPTFSPGGGNYIGTQSVAIASATSGATIRYTTDGSTPSETTGTVYSSPVTVSATTTINAIAYKSGLADSTVSAAAYTIQATAPTFSPAGGTYTSAQSVTISSTTSGTTIRYTTDGSTPSETNGTVYSSPVTVSATTTINAIAYKSGLADSTVSTATYTIQVAAPTFSPAGGTYTSVQSVTISSATSGATIRYTTNYTTPTETNGTLYSGPVPITATTFLQAIAYKSGLTDSPVASSYYTINLPPTATPAFSPAPGTYASGQTVTITSATSGASIRYTTNGSIPSETTGTLYSAPVSINSTTMLTAIAYKAGFSDSGVTGGTYTINYPPAAAPAFSPAAGTYASTQTVMITSATSGTTIRYTTDGSTPTETNGIIYSGPVSISRTTMLKAIAYRTGFAGDSPQTSGLYVITSSLASCLNVLYDFGGSNNGGIYPYAGLVLGNDGNFYSTTSSGGIGSYGTVFKITPAGVLTSLTSFSYSTSGAYPYAGLVLGNDGNFYGTNYYGGIGNAGTVFRITPSGVLTTVASFNYFANGAGPNAGLVQGSDGNFYGTTTYGGSDSFGTVFKMTPSGVLTSLVSFTGANGEYPFASLIQGSDGNFYGTTAGDGFASIDGTVFKMTSAGVLTSLVSFTGANGAYPYSSLVQGSDGNFYGTTSGDGVNNYGTVFKMTPAGALTNLVSFTDTNGAYPYAGLMQGSDGNFYGTTSGDGFNTYGTVFKMTPAGVLTTLASFDDANGDAPAGLIQGPDGNLYGTAESGGLFIGGVVFQLIIPPTAAPAFSPAAGTYTAAQTVTITSAMSGASIRYTIDGSAPSETNGTLYSGPVSISSTTTLKAIAYETGFKDSSVTSGTYTIIIPTPTPTAPSGGGGGGAFDDWFLGFLAFVGLLRWKRRKA